MDQTIFDLFAPLLTKLGITSAWLNAAAVNVGMILGMIKPKFPQIDNWKEESAVVAIIALALAGATFYANVWAIPVAVTLVWFGTTFIQKTGAQGVTLAHGQFNKAPTKNEGASNEGETSNP